MTFMGILGAIGTFVKDVLLGLLKDVIIEREPEDTHVLGSKKNKDDVNHDVMSQLDEKSKSKRKAK